jgi:hypothetical protein
MPPSPCSPVRTLQELLDDLGRGVLALLPLKDRLHGRQPRGLAAA